MLASKRILLSIFAILLAVAVGLVVRYLQIGSHSPLQAFKNRRAKAVHAASKVQEYTISVSSRSTSGPGSRADAPRLDNELIVRRVYAVRKDGSRLTSTFQFGIPGTRIKPLEQRQIIDVTERKSIWYVPEINARSTITLNEQMMANVLGGSNPECAGPHRTIEQRSSILGWPAALLKDPAGATTWVLPDFDCTSVRWSREFMRDGQMVSRSSGDIDTVEVGPPDPQLFLALGLEVKPTDMERKMGEYQGLPQSMIEKSLSPTKDQRWLASMAANSNPALSR